MSKFLIDFHESQVEIRERMKARIDEKYHLSDIFLDSSAYRGVDKSWCTVVSIQNTMFILLFLFMH